MNYVTKDSGKRESGNNCVENLEWVSPKENMKHAFRKGLMGTLDENKVKEIKALRKNTTLTQKEIGNLFGLAPNTISQIINKKRWGWLS